MSKSTKFLLSAACAAAVTFGAAPAYAGPATSGAGAPSAATSIAGIRMDQIQQVDRRGWRSGGYRGGRSWGGGRRYSGGGYRGGRYYGGGRRYYGGYGGYRRHRGYGGYAAAGILGLTAGALIANNAYGGDGYYGGNRYYGGECRVVTRGYDDYGRPVRYVRYRPC